MGVAPFHLGLLSQICRPSSRRGWGDQPRPPTREIPLTEPRMVLFATQPKTLSPADPCNKVQLRRKTRTSQRAEARTGAVRVGEAPSDAVPAAAL